MAERKLSVNFLSFNVDVQGGFAGVTARWITSLFLGQDVQVQGYVCAAICI